MNKWDGNSLVSVATDDFLSILRKVERLFGKIAAAKVADKIRLHIGLLSSFPRIGVYDAIVAIKKNIIV